MKFRRKFAFHETSYHALSYAKWAELPLYEKVLVILLFSIAPAGVIVAVFTKATAPDDAAAFARVIIYTVAIASILMALVIAVHFRPRKGFLHSVSCVFGGLGIFLVLAPSLYMWSIEFMGIEKGLAFVFLTPWVFLGIWMVIHGGRIRAKRKARYSSKVEATGNDNEQAVSQDVVCSEIEIDRYSSTGALVPGQSDCFNRDDYLVTLNQNNGVRKKQPDERRTLYIDPENPKSVCDKNDRTATTFIWMGIACIVLVILCTAMLLKIEGQLF